MLLLWFYNILMLLCFVPFLFISEKLQNQKWLVSLGQHSLGIMLLHAPMCHTAAVILNRVFEPASLYWIVSFLIAYVCIVFVSYWGTVLIERYIPIMLGKKSCSRAYLFILSRCSELILGLSFNARDTVATDTFSALAMSFIVIVVFSFMSCFFVIPAKLDI